MARATAIIDIIKEEDLVANAHQKMSDNDKQSPTDQPAVSDTDMPKVQDWALQIQDSSGILSHP